MIKVYLDTSTYNRPFDDQTQPKIFLESQAVTLILQMVETKIVELVSSSAKYRTKTEWLAIAAVWRY